MKVVHYSTSLDKSSGGTAAYIQLLAKELGKLVELHIITHHVENPLPMENCTIHEVATFNHPLKFKKECRALLKELNPDVVHVNLGWMPGSSYFLFNAKKMGFKVVLHTHGMLEKWAIKKNYWTRKLPAILLYMRRATKNSDILVATSAIEEKNLVELSVKWRLSYHIYNIPNGIEVDEIKLKENWKPRKQIMYMGLLRENKGPHYLIRAVAKLKEQLNGYKVIIAGNKFPGEEDYVESLHKMIKDYGLENIISMPGGVYNEEKWKIYQESDVFVLPTLNENFGIVVAEALACGTPVITTKGAPWEVLERERCGWWVERTDDAITNALKSAISLNEEKLKPMGLRGRKMVEEKCSSKAVAKMMYNMYKILKYTDE